MCWLKDESVHNSLEDICRYFNCSLIFLWNMLKKLWNSGKSTFFTKYYKCRNYKCTYGRYFTIVGESNKRKNWPAVWTKKLLREYQSLVPILGTYLQIPLAGLKTNSATPISSKRRCWHRTVDNCVLSCCSLHYQII